jgi:hypothetical protein
MSVLTAFSVCKIIVMAILERYDSANHSTCDNQCGNQHGKPCVFEFKHFPYPKVRKRKREEKAVNAKEHAPYRMLGMLVTVTGVITDISAVRLKITLRLVVVIITLAVVIFVIVVVHISLLSARLRAT